ncbi:hypothetical protein [Millionella massiliensis]|uniref:hypothetical protein n=1 Tax=Millionella massiliensis TaxID=1871023 RepID=UPI0024B6B3E5|nr:hypothetical protein [Millionella massiliensis]
MKPITLLTAATMLLSVPELSAQTNSGGEKNYWNEKTLLIPYRLAPGAADQKPTYIDLDGDGKPEVLRTVTTNGIPVQWIDDDGDMEYGDLEGDTDNDCLMVDRNKDGIYGGYGDLIIDWVGEDDEGNPAMQVVVDNIAEKNRIYPSNGHYMWVIDTDKDNIFNYIDWHNFSLRCWIHNGLSDFYEDYHGQLYVSPMDGKIHLYGAEWGCWRIDQNTRYYQGMGGIYDGYGPKRAEREPTKFPTVKYTDTNENGFFDLMEFDLDGDTLFEQRISLIDLGIDDRCPIINTADMEYDDFVKLQCSVSDQMWKNAEKAIEAAEAKKLNTDWYALMKHPKSTRQRYHYGFWLQFYLYNDLKDLARRTNDTALAEVIDRAYLQGKWELVK